MRVPHVSKTASSVGLLATVPEGGIGVAPTARVVASPPRYGLPLYQGPLATMFGSGVSPDAAADAAEGLAFECLVVIAAPLVIILCARSARVIAVGVRHAYIAGHRGAVLGSVSEDVPVKALAGPLEDAVNRLAGVVVS